MKTIKLKVMGRNTLWVWVKKGYKILVVVGEWVWEMVCMPMGWFLDGLDTTGYLGKDRGNRLEVEVMKRKGTPKMTYEEAFERRRMNLENKIMFGGWSEADSIEEHKRLMELYRRGGSERV